MKLEGMEKELFEYIVNFVEENKYPPTLREMCSGMGWKSTNSPREIMVKLETKGYLKRIPEISRGLIILKELSK
jgi:repressor LexA